MTPVEFEHAIPDIERSQIHALDALPLRLTYVQNRNNESWYLHLYTKRQNEFVSFIAGNVLHHPNPPPLPVTNRSEI